jgi:VIT1/CCC1 family predicted Fe2+/Mn2+ transporter
MVDGILNALTLAAGPLLRSHGGTSFGLACRVGAAAALTTLFVFFVAHYAELRAELVRAERQLNLSSHGPLAASRLGRRALYEAAASATLAAACGLVGAACPLLLSTVLPGPGWIGLCATIVLLGVLGAVLARSFYGSVLFWSFAIMAGGIALTFVGIELNLVS